MYSVFVDQPQCFVECDAVSDHVIHLLEELLCACHCTVVTDLILIHLFAQASPASALAPAAGTSVPGEFEEEVRCVHDILHKTQMLETCDLFVK